jgi:hypothetical protein
MNFFYLVKAYFASVSRIVASENVDQHQMCSIEGVKEILEKSEFSASFAVIKSHQYESGESHVLQIHIGDEKISCKQPY